MPADRRRRESRDSTRLRSTAFALVALCVFAGGLVAGCGAGSSGDTPTTPSGTAGPARSVPVFTMPTETRP